MMLNYAMRWLRWFRRTATVNPAPVIPEFVITGLSAIPGVIEVRLGREGLTITIATADWFAVRRRVHWWTQDNNQSVKVGWWLDPNAEPCRAYDRMERAISSLGYQRPRRRSTPEP